jgi:hypothetical protein
VPTTTLEAREQIIHDLGAATVQITFAVGCLSAAYELLDEANADRLEGDLFRPVQRALGQAKRANSAFAGRYGLTAPVREAPSPGLASQGVKALVEKAATAAGEASRRIAELQDSMLPIEAGDAELRAALAEIREQVDRVGTPARQFLSTLGR